MTKHEADVIGGLNMTDQISNEAYKQIMIAAQEENEVNDVLDKIRAEIEQIHGNEYEVSDIQGNRYKYETIEKAEVLQIIDKYRESEEQMIQINDNDLPIMVAEKIINGTKPYNPTTDLMKAIAKAVTQDMFDIEEIKEIADYLMVYYQAHQNGD